MSQLITVSQLIKQNLPPSVLAKKALATQSKSVHPIVQSTPRRSTATASSTTVTTTATAGTAAATATATARIVTATAATSASTVPATASIKLLLALRKVTL